MIPVRLETRNGELVVTGRIPPFLPCCEPDVIVWGVRVYSFFGRLHTPTEECIYREVFAVALIEHHPPEADGPLLPLALPIAHRTES